MPIYDPTIILDAGKVKIPRTARIDSFVKIEGGQGVVIGENVHIASFCHLNIGGGELVIEDNANCSSGVRIITAKNDLAAWSVSAALPAHTQKVERLKTVIKRNAVLYSGAIILAGVTVGEFAIVGAGAVVTKNVPAFEIWVGNPARRIGKREDIQASRNGHGFEDM